MSTNTHTYVLTYMHAQTRAHLHHTYLLTHTHRQTHTHTHTHNTTHIYMRMCACTHAYIKPQEQAAEQRMEQGYDMPCHITKSDLIQSNLIQRHRHANQRCQSFAQ